MAFPPNIKQIQFFVGATPITNPILMQCIFDIPTLQAAINAAIIAAGYTISVIQKTPAGFTFSVSVPSSVVITSPGRLVITTNQGTTEIPFTFICSIKQNRLLVISKMKAGLLNNP